MGDDPSEAGGRAGGPAQPPAASCDHTVRLVRRAGFAFNARMQGTGHSAANAAAPLEMWLTAVGRDRDRRAYAALFGHFAPRVKAYLRRLGTDPAACEELAQEVMLLVWRRAETYDPAQASASTWIFTIARNRRVDAIRREQRPEFDAEDPSLVPDPAEPADRTVELAQETRRLQAALGALPPEQAELIQLAYFEDKPHSAIAEERGLPLGTVKSRLRLAMDRLRRALKDGP